MMEKIVFFGAGPYALPIVKILKENFEIQLVVTTDLGGPLAGYCALNNIPVQGVSSLKDFVTKYPDIVYPKVAVLASFGLLVPGELMDKFNYGIINIHPSLLPEYRGSTPVQQALLDGKTATGVSVMKLDSELDHGPILAQTEEKIQPNDTSETLYNRLFEIGTNLLVDYLPKYISGEIKPTEQNHEKATFTNSLLSRDSGFIDINNPPENEIIERMIKAYYPWPGIWFRANLNGKEKIIKLFPEEKIQVEGKNIMAVKDFLNGYAEGKQILSKLKLNG